METTVKVGKNLPEIDGFMLEIEAATKREKEWKKEAKSIVKIYESEKDDCPFNILFSNTETISPALYNMTPRPQVRRRYHDADPLGKAGTQVLQRTIEYLMENDLGHNTEFDEVMPDVVLDSLVPGRGILWHEYQAPMKKIPAEKAIIPEEGQQVQELNPAGEPEVLEEVDYELITTSHAPWDRFLHGYAKKWKNVPWIAREHFMTVEELKENFGDAAKGVPLTVSPKGEESEEGAEKSGEDVDPTMARVWEFWHKESRRVLFFCPDKRDAYLRDAPDPLELTGFFPTPGVLCFYRSTKGLTPIPLYKSYQKQAEELNLITTRINRIVKAIKIRGFYDSQVEGLSELLKADDNTLLPADNVAAMQDGGGLEKAIWLMPLEKLITVLQQLYMQRDQIKSIIYEITGVSDILRGAGRASESATAQNIKSQWGSLRLKRWQKMVQQYARDSMRIMAEMACKKFSVETFRAMTGLPFPTRAEKMQAQQQMVVLQQQMAMMAAQQAQMGQPLQPPQMPPEVAQIQQMLAMPSWEDILEMLNNDLKRSYKIDIETNSTIDAEATEDKEQMGEFLNAVAQFLNGIGPMVEQGILPFEAAKAMLLAVTRRYKFGPEVEEELAKMAAPKPQSDGKQEAAAAEMQGQQKLMEMEITQAQSEAALKTQVMQQEKVYKDALHQQMMIELSQRNAFAEADHRRKLETLEAQRQAAKEKTVGVTPR